MKKILPAAFAFSFKGDLTKCMKSYIKVLHFIFLALMLLSTKKSFSQAQVIGSFPDVMGSVESQTMGTTYPLVTNTQYTTFNKQGGTPTINTTGGCSSPYYIAWTTSSTSSQSFITPTVNTTGVVQLNTDYIIQFHYKYASSAKSVAVDVSTDGTSNFSSATSFSIANVGSTWTLISGKVTTPSSGNARYGVIRFSPSGSSWSNAISIDDIVMYQASTPDGLIPSAATNASAAGASSTSLIINWTGAQYAGDGGGYVIVRSTSATAVTLNQNGIYAVGNTSATGGGTIVAITGGVSGANQSFTDVGLTSGTTYYYSIFAVDKAFNYASAATCNGTPSSCISPTAFSVNSSGTNICTGSSTNITTNGSQVGVTYELYKDGVTTGTTISGTGSPLSFSVSPTTGAPLYTLNTTTAGGYCATTLTGSTTVTVNPVSVGGTANYAGSNICVSGTPSAALTVSGNTGTTYQWQSSTMSATIGFSDIGGATSATYLPGAITQTTYYRVNITSGSCLSASSVADTIIVNSTSPSITGQPSSSSQSICSGGSLTALSLTATGTTLTYQWYSNASNSNSGGTLIGGATNTNYTPSNATASSLYYYCLVSTNGGCASASSPSGLITVYTTSVGGTVTYNGSSICSSGTPSTALVVTGNTGSTYQWQSSTTSATTGFSDIGGATSATYLPGSISTTTYYRVNVSNGVCSAASSVADTILVSSSASITGQPSTSAQSISIGGALTALSVSATGISLTYQWYKNVSNSNIGGTVISGATNSNYTPSNASASSYYYYCVITSNGACSVTSNQSGLITVSGTVSTDYFRSISSGSWTSSSTWQSSSDSVTWFSAASAPTSSAAYVTVQSPNVVTVSSGVTTGNAGVLSGGSLKINTGGSISVNTGKLLTINGTVESTIIGSSVFTSTSSTMNFSSTGVFIQSAAAISFSDTTSQNIQVPYAMWASGALCKITGIVGLTDIDYRGIQGINQTFADMTIDCPNLVGKIVLAYNGDGPNANTFAINGTLTINSLGGTATSNGKMLQITSSSGQRSVTVGNYVQHTGSVYITNQTQGSTGDRVFVVNGSFTVDNALGTSYFYHGDPQQKSGTINGVLKVGGDFYMATGTTEKQQYGTVGNSGSGTGITTAELIFTGTTAQNASFGNFSSGISITVLNSTNTVTLLTNLTMNDTLYLNGTMAINGNTLTLDSILTGSGYLTGSMTSNLTIGNGGGTTPSLKFTPTGNNANWIKNFTVNASAKCSLNNTLNITYGVAPGVVTLGNNCTMATNDNLVLKSDAHGTARVAQVSVNGSGVAQCTFSGKVTVERFYNALRSWRLVSAPILTTNAPTINASWQEGGVSITGGSGVNAAPANLNAPYGTHISGPSPGVASGFDQTPLNNYSILCYTGGTWAGSGLNTYISLKSYPGYMLFVRGDRSYPITTTTNYTTPQTAVLRSTGYIKLGDTTITVSAGGGFQVVGNPFPSTIDFHKATRTGSVSDVFYIWDPNLTGSNYVGAYVSFAWNSATSKYDKNIRSGPSSGATYTSGILDSTIQSGQAFMVMGTGTLKIKESDKLSTSPSNAFRPSGEADVTENGSYQELRVNLLAKNSDGTISLNDGVLSSFSPAFNDSNKINSAPKIPNMSEYISIFSNGSKWAIEQRPPVKWNDTISYVLNKVKYKNYQLEILAQDMNQPGLVGFVIDNYTKTREAISLNGATYFDFTINTDSGSFSANRFKIIFASSLGAPLPIKFEQVKANKINGNINVEWTVQNEIGSPTYIVEKSTDGVHFTSIDKHASNLTQTYNSLDVNVLSNVDYYRIRCVESTGQETVSKVVMVDINKADASVGVYPTALISNDVVIQFNNKPLGAYTFSLTNTIGQLLYSKTLQNSGGNYQEKLHFDNAILSKGMYQLEVLGFDNVKTIVTLLK